MALVGTRLASLCLILSRTYSSVLHWRKRFDTRRVCRPQGRGVVSQPSCSVDPCVHLKVVISLSEADWNSVSSNLIDLPFSLADLFKA